MSEDGNLCIVPTELTEFEKIVISLCFSQTSPNRTKTGLVLTFIELRYEILRVWVPTLGKTGEHLSILPIPHEYFAKELPNDIAGLGLTTIAFILDGKETVSDTLRKEDAMKRKQRSEKTYASGFRWLNFMTPAGLTFEHTRAFGARATEVDSR